MATRKMKPSKKLIYTIIDEITLNVTEPFEDILDHTEVNYKEAKQRLTKLFDYLEGVKERVKFDKIKTTGET